MHRDGDGGGLFRGETGFREAIGKRPHGVRGRVRGAECRGFVSCRLSVEIDASHHRDGRCDGTRCAGDQHRFRVGGRSGDTKDQAEDGNGSVFHSKDDGAG